MRHLDYQRVSARVRARLTPVLLRGLRPVWSVLHAALFDHLMRHGGRVPSWYFETAPMLMPQSCIELLLTARDAQGRLLLYVERRSATDPYWPGEWHVPGTTMYAMDTWEQMCQRLDEGELHGLMDGEVLKPEMLFASTHADRARGPCLHLVCEYRLSPAKYAWAVRTLPGRFVEAASLPRDMIEHQTVFIDAFLEGRRTSSKMLDLEPSLR